MIIIQIDKIKNNLAIAKPNPATVGFFIFATNNSKFRVWNLNLSKLEF